MRESDEVNGWVISGEMTLSLPSVDELLPFAVHLVVEAKWPEDSPPPALLDIARHGVALRAERLSRQRALTEAVRLRDGLSTVLHRWQHVPGTGVLARGHCTSVDVDHELVAMVKAREEAARRWFAASWQDERRAQQAEQMRSRLLDPLRATAWWFLDNQDKPDRLAEVAQAFETARDALAPEDVPDSPGRLVDDLLATPDPAVKTHLAEVLERIFNGYGRDDLSARLKAWQARDEGVGEP